MNGKAKRIFQFFVEAFLFIVILVLSVALVIGIGYGYQILRDDGLFSSWRKLDPGYSFVEILDATNREVWAKTLSGSIYYLDTYCTAFWECNAWIETGEVPQDVYKGGLTINKSTQCKGFKYLKAPSGNLLECIRVNFYGAETGSVYYYALIDGNIWRWVYSSSMIDDFVVYFLAVPLGFALGIWANVFLKAKLRQ
jgi:hypothetical protein